MKVVTYAAGLLFTMMSVSFGIAFHGVAKLLRIETSVFKTLNENV